ncbi:MAG: GIY-YIG nuclease family protein, partial [Candidatus Heimdallarchaeota archaeon]|nr:GIY-YIG nuclease family protein [Candidatus Heimdallarchaeota archaeon]
HTNNLEKRLKQHSTGIGSKYVRSRLPLKLIYTEQLETRSLAMKREYAIKKFDRKRKEDLILSS